MCNSIVCTTMCNAGVNLVAALWAPDSSCCVLVMSPSSHAAVLYFTAAHPSLEAQFLPLLLQGVGGKGTERVESSMCPAHAPVPFGTGMELFGAAWDARGARLVLGCMQSLGEGGSDDAPPETVPHAAVFSTTFKPVLHTLHMGNQPLQRGGTAEVGWCCAWACCWLTGVAINARTGGRTAPCVCLCECGPGGLWGVQGGPAGGAGGARGGAVAAATATDWLGCVILTACLFTCMIQRG